MYFLTFFGLFFCIGLQGLLPTDHAQKCFPAGPIDVTLYIRDHFVKMFAGEFLAAIPRLEARPRLSYRGLNDPCMIDLIRLTN